MPGLNLNRTLYLGWALSALTLMGCAVANGLVPQHPISIAIIEYGEVPSFAYPPSRPMWSGTRRTVTITDRLEEGRLVSLFDHLPRPPNNARCAGVGVTKGVTPPGTDVTFTYPSGSTITLQIGDCGTAVRLGNPSMPPRQESGELHQELFALLAHCPLPVPKGVSAFDLRNCGQS